MIYDGIGIFTALFSVGASAAALLFYSTTWPKM
jgi:hypothetical protein